MSYGTALKYRLPAVSFGDGSLLSLGPPYLHLSGLRPPHRLLAALLPDELTTTLGSCLGWRFCRGNSLPVKTNFFRFDSRSLLADGNFRERIFRRRDLRLPQLQRL